MSINRNEYQTDFGFKLAPIQAEFIRACLDPRYKEICLLGGRGGGKDLVLGALTSIIGNKYKNVSIGFATPLLTQVKGFFDQVMRGYNSATEKFWVPQTFDMKRMPYEIKFWNAKDLRVPSMVFGMTTESPESIHGKRCNILIINECDLIDEEIVLKDLRPILKKGLFYKIIYVTAPKGKTWFHRKYIQGLKDPNDPLYNSNMARKDIISFKLTYRNNPFTSANIERERETLPKNVFLQEYEAEFIDAYSIWTDLQKAFFPVTLEGIDTNLWVGEEPQKEANGVSKGVYCLGVDYAQTKDWTVFTVINQKTGKVCYWERFQGVNTAQLALRTLELAHKYNDATIIYDETGMGRGVGDNMYQYQINNRDFSKILLTPQWFTNELKQDLIAGLVSRIEKTPESFIPQIPTIWQEMEALERQLTPSGKMTYNAKNGYHDDCVWSLALANQEYINNRASMDVVNNFFKR